MITGVALLTVSAGLSAQQVQKHRLPAARTQEELKLGQERSRLSADPFTQFGKAGGIQMPANVRYPGEFEESQAVAISWSLNYNNQGNPTDVDTTSIYGYISAQLAHYLSEELPVWIRVPSAADSTKALQFMTSLGWPLTHNYRFFVTTCDDWWMRDFGPNGIYYGSQDSVGFVDLHYYDGRDQDNIFPSFLANQLGYKNIVSKMYGEGGNLMTDGFGKVFYSDMFTEANGHYGLHSPEWSSGQTTDTLKNVFNTPETVMLPKLNCDGGTGHIDLYVKLIDEQTLMIAKYPNEVTAGDKKIIEDNVQYLASLKTTYNRPFRLFRIPHPTGDDGTYKDTSCSKLDFDARTFINGITANKTFIYPSYSDDIDGNQAQTAEVTGIFEKIMPGYKVIPIDSRAITTNGGGGAIHCITMQIPAENPVLFWHPSIDGIQPKTSSYHILAKVTNHSGIASAVCKWRIKGNAAWNTLNLTDSSGYFIGDINPGTLTDNDQIQYYLTATTNNGKTAVKPITAPDGFYTILFKYQTGVSELEEIKAKDHLFGAYPNPASHSFTIPFNLVDQASVQIVLTDLVGKEVMSVQKGRLAAGTYQETMDASQLGNGVYFYSLILNGEKLSTRKLLIQQ